MIGAALVDGTVEPIRQEIAVGDGRGWVIGSTHRAMSTDGVPDAI
jgi:hypothetical protein